MQGPGPRLVTYLSGDQGYVSNVLFGFEVNRTNRDRSEIFTKMSGEYLFVFIPTSILFKARIKLKLAQFEGKAEQLTRMTVEGMASILLTYSSISIHMQL